MNNILEFLVGMGDLLLGKKEEKIKEEPIEKFHSEQINPKKYSFRPQNLDQYVGQERAKELVKLNLEKIMTIKPVHFIISGTKGTGKSTLAYIIGNQLGFDINTYVAGSFTMENLQQFLEKNEESTIPQILFIDEIHSLDKSLGEFLYPLLEDFLLPIGGIEVRPFCFIGATTDLNILQKKLSPMIDRCGANIKLEHYEAKDIKEILKQYNDQIYKQDTLDEVYDILSKNVRYTPRIALAYYDDYIVCKDIKKVLHIHRIIKNSLTTDDILVLKHLKEIGKPIGVEVLAIITNQTKSDYMTLQEPFLLQQGYITRTSQGRLINSKGIQL